MFFSLQRRTKSDTYIPAGTDGARETTSGVMPDIVGYLDTVLNNFFWSGTGPPRALRFFPWKPLQQIHLLSFFV